MPDAKIRALSAAWARGENSFTKILLGNRKCYGFTEVLKALTLLDYGRNARVAEKKLKRLQFQKNKVHPQKVGKVKSEMDNFNKIKPSDFALPWFLPYCFGQDPPDEAMHIKEGRSVTKETVNDFVAKHQVPFTLVKAHAESITDENKGKLAREEAQLDTVLWYYESLKCRQVDEAISARLEKGEMFTLASGKLLERLLTLKMLREGIPLSRDEEHRLWHTWDWDRYPEGPDNTPKPDTTVAPFIDNLINLTEKNIADISLSLEEPIVIMGDRSPSMEVAIRTISIIGGVLTAITSAKLVFFDDDKMEAPYLPKTIPEVLSLAIEVGSGTTPVASLKPLYLKKEVVQRSCTCNG